MAQDKRQTQQGTGKMQSIIKTSEKYKQTALSQGRDELLDHWKQVSPAQLMWLTQALLLNLSSCHCHRDLVPILKIISARLSFWAPFTTLLSWPYGSQRCFSLLSKVLNISAPGALAASSNFWIAFGGRVPTVQTTIICDGFASCTENKTCSPIFCCSPKLMPW